MAEQRSTSNGNGSKSVAPKPLGDFSQIVVCVDSCTPVSDMHRIMTQWRNAESVIRSEGHVYPDIRIGITNQLLREQTNITDLDTLLAFKDLKTGAGQFFKENADALRHENTGPCRHFAKALIEDILPMRAFPALDEGSPESVINTVKAVAYYVLHLEDQLSGKSRAKQWGDAPAILSAGDGLSYDEVKKNAAAFSKVALPRNFSGVHTSHALLTGIRATELWPWMDRYFTQDPDRKTLLEDIHFNQADLSMIDFSRRLTADPGTIDPKQTLFVLVSRDGGLMQQMVEFTYGFRRESVPIDNSEYKDDLDRINELTRGIRAIQDQQRRELKEHGVFVTEDLIGELGSLKDERYRLKQKYEVPLRETGKRPGKGKTVEMVPIRKDDYEQHRASGLKISPVAYEDVPEIMVMPPHRFLEMMKGHQAELIAAHQEGASPEMRGALAGMDASIKLLQIGEGNEKSDKEPEAAYKLGKATRQHAKEKAAEMDPTRRIFDQIGLRQKGEGWSKRVQDD